MSRTALRTAAVLGATAALTFAGAGVAAATTSHDVEGNTLSVTFTKDSTFDVSVCFAAVVPTAGAAGIIGDVQAAASGSPQAILDLVTGGTGVTVLKNENNNPIPSVVAGDQTVSAELEPNVYTLISKCTGDDLVLEPIVFVGGPFEAIMGSVEMGSSGGGLDTLSSVIGGGEEDGGVGALLSSTLGGDNEGGFLDGISSNGDDE